MRAVQKRAIAAGCIGVLLIGGVAVVTRLHTSTDNEKENSTEAGSESRVVKQPADLTFWYNDASYQEFSKRAAEEYYEDTGCAVSGYDGLHGCHL